MGAPSRCERGSGTRAIDFKVSNLDALCLMLVPGCPLEMSALPGSLDDVCTVKKLEVKLLQLDPLFLTQSQHGHGRCVTE